MASMSATERRPPPTVSGDVEKDQLVGALGVIGLGGLDGVAGVAQLDELHALDDASGVDVEAGDDAAGEHGVF
jgi:hypothetical protein